MSAGTLKVLRNSSSVINHSCTHSGADAADSGARTADPRMLDFGMRTKSDCKRALEVKVCLEDSRIACSFGAWPGALQPSQVFCLNVVVTCGIDLVYCTSEALESDDRLLSVRSLGTCCRVHSDC